MVDVVVHEKTFEKSKLHATIIEKVRKKMIEHPSSTRPPPGGKKWEEIVGLNGARYAVACRWEGGKVMMTRVRRTPIRKGRIRKRKK